MNFRLAIVLPAALFLCFCTKENESKTVEFPESYFEILSRSASISVRVYIPGEAEVRYVGVAVSLLQDPSADPDAISRRVKRTPEAEYRFDISGLEPETSYWFSPFVVFSDGTSEYGRAQGFTTQGAKMLDGHEFVNLGLTSGIKWAAFNAELPDGSSRFSIASVSGAMALWNGSWRLPERQEWEELMAECFWSWDVQGGMQGMLVKGPNGNTLFLPADGYEARGELMSHNDYGAYWAFEESASSPGSFWSLFFGMDFVYWNPLHQSCGASVRPVSNATVYDY